MLLELIWMDKANWSFFGWRLQRLCNWKTHSGFPTLENNKFLQIQWERSTVLFKESQPISLKTALIRNSGFVPDVEKINTIDIHGISKKRFLRFEFDFKASKKSIQNCDIPFNSLGLANYIMRLKSLFFLHFFA